MTTTLDPSQTARYARQLKLPEVGEAGQLRMRNASAVIVGAGGLGSPAALYLASAGIGRLGIVDADRVDLSNLHRQILHGTSDVGRTKVESAADRLRAANPEVRVETWPVTLQAANALEILGGYDIVLDGSDNFETRYLVNDATVLLRKPNVYGSVFRFEGQASVFIPQTGPCYRCLYPEPPPSGFVPSCEEGGVLGVLPGLIGLIQATEAIKWILGLGNGLAGRLLLFDALNMKFREVKLRRNPGCAACGDSPTILELTDTRYSCTLPVPVETDVSASELEALLASKEIALIDVREPHEYSAGHIEGARLIPLRSLQGALAEIDQSKPVVLYCRSGARSARGIEILRAAGVVNVRHLAGGILSWNTRGVH